MLSVGSKFMTIKNTADSTFNSTWLHFFVVELGQCTTITRKYHSFVVLILLLKKETDDGMVTRHNRPLQQSLTKDFLLYVF